MSRWQERLEYVESIDLTAVAAEVDARRLRTLQEQRLANGGEVPHELRGDQKCDAPRMQRALQALCRMTGDRRKPFDVVCTHQVLAQRLGVSVRTARRAVYDLRDASLLIVDSRPFEHRRGGDGANGYRFVWATIVDIALTQGVQLRLPLSVGEVPDRMTEEPGSSPETGRPDNPSGCETADPEAARGGPVVPLSTGGHEVTTGGHRGHAGGHCGHAGGHCGHAGGHCGHAGGHEIAPNAGAGAGARPHGRAPSSRELTEKPPSTPYPLVPGSSVVGSREGEGGEDSGWNEVRLRLRAAGVSAIRLTVATAIDAGVRPQHVLALVDFALRRAVDGVAAWAGGAIHRRIMETFPGDVVDEGWPPPSEAWVRAKRDAELQLARRRSLLVEDRRTEEFEMRRAAEQAERSGIDGEIGRRIDERFGATTFLGEARFAARGEALVVMLPSTFARDYVRTSHRDDVQSLAEEFGLVEIEWEVAQGTAVKPR